MFNKDEKKALTRLAVLSIGWGVGLDRFYEGRTKDGILSIVGWTLVFGTLFYLSPCQGYEYTEGVKNYSDMAFNPYSIFPIGFGAYGIILVIRKAFKLLRSFESSD
ncbi:MULTISPECIES: hypothetical protein [unclassified Prochlorococcus]|uniref:hypothetical protein n=1 Tax=unclassified Prochlorococcus TaxID=2627481 RepID=UPI0005337C48|nr:MULTISPECIES: hypothetical protein [unclassified Prochlorococcus]KGG15523.1 hypothetical protein EV06_1397 [Prochlorococcus sp. MIT 0602]KGG17803.1 hypothetical protein EV07_1245 [Prochlorococcus sp. MIT 0603]